MNASKNINDFTLISFIEKLEILDISYTYILDISFLRNNKQIKELNLNACKDINYFTPISSIEKLEILNISSEKQKINLLI